MSSSDGFYSFFGALRCPRGYSGHYLVGLALDAAANILKSYPAQTETSKLYKEILPFLNPCDIAFARIALQGDVPRFYNETSFHYTYFTVLVEECKKIANLLRR